MKTVDVNDLTPEQEEVLDRFLSALAAGESVSRHDFPEMDGEDFDALAQAVLLEALSTRH